MATGLFYHFHALASVLRTASSKTGGGVGLETRLGLQAVAVHAINELRVREWVELTHAPSHHGQGE